MSVIKCPECGHDVSDKAPCCPFCGVEISGNITVCPQCGCRYLSSQESCPECHHPNTSEKSAIENKIETGGNKNKRNILIAVLPELFC